MRSVFYLKQAISLTESRLQSVQLIVSNLHKSLQDNISQLVRFDIFCPMC